MLAMCDFKELRKNRKKLVSSFGRATFSYSAVQSPFNIKNATFYNLLQYNYKILQYFIIKFFNKMIIKHKKNIKEL